jgi:hypothetical protein
MQAFVAFALLNDAGRLLLCEMRYSSDIQIAGRVIFHVIILMSSAEVLYSSIKLQWCGI